MVHQLRRRLLIVSCAVLAVAVCFVADSGSATTTSAPCDCDGDGFTNSFEPTLIEPALFGDAGACLNNDFNVDSSVSAADLIAVATCPLPTLRFTDVTAAAGLNYVHGLLDDLNLGILRMVSGGTAAGDYDGDGWVDLYPIRGGAGTNLLFRNRGDGTFEEVSAAAGVDLPANGGWSGPSFADIDGDGWLDLFVGSVVEAPKIFRNRGDGTFEEIVDSAPFQSDIGPYLDGVFGDYDGDRDLDLFTARWGTFDDGSIHDHLWRNNGDGTFTPATLVSGILIASSMVGTPDLRFWTQGTNFADINSDGFQDILAVADFDQTQVFLNSGDGTFLETTDTAIITDENGMGGAVIDYDHDGDLDWFVSSVSGLSNRTGNRLYRNRGDGVFDDATEEAGVRDGLWGWGSCFADFDNNGRPDIFHVNGRGQERDDPFFMTPERLFMAQPDGRFLEQAVALGITARVEGLGVVCFDYDRDGDIDIFITNVNQAPRLYRNDGGNGSASLEVRLRGEPPNTEGIGARVVVTANDVEQMQEIRVSQNYVSQDPAVAHFGLGRASVARVRVQWPDGAITVCPRVSTNAFVAIDRLDGVCRITARS